MALTDFRRRNERVETAEAPRRPASRTTYLDSNSEFSGRLTFKEDVQIDGSIEGEVECAKTVMVGPAARIHATISSESVVIHGQVEGDIVARREITLHKSACVRGDMKTAGIVIEPGAKVEGRIVIGSDAERSAPAPKSGNGSDPERR